MSLSKQTVLLFLIVWTIYSCKQAPEEAPPQLLGNWFFIDEQLDSLFIYNEAYINQNELHLRFSKNSLISPCAYTLQQSTVYLTSADSVATPFWSIQKASADTLWVDLLDKNQQVLRSLELVRLKAGEKGPLDYHQEAWKKDQNLWQIYETDFQRRYDEYTTMSGRNSWETLARAKADSVNRINVVYENPEP